MYMFSENKIYSVYKPEARTVAMSIVVPYGVVQERNNEYGAAHLLEHLLPTPYITQFAAMGVRTDFQTRVEETVFSFTYSARFFQEVTVLIKKMLQGSDLTEEMLLQERSVIEQECATDDLDASAATFFDKVVAERIFHGTALCRDTAILSDDVRRASLQDMKVLFQRHYHPHCMTVGLVGPLSRDVVQGTLVSDREEQKQENLCTYSMPPLVLQDSAREEITVSGAVQRMATVVFVFQKTTFRDAVVHNLLAEIYEAAFVAAFRDEYALAYDARVNIKAYTTMSVMSFNLTVAQTVSADALWQLLHRFFLREDIIAPKGTARAQQLLCTDCDFTQDAMVALAEYLALENNQKPEDVVPGDVVTPDMERSVILGVTRDELQAAARQFHRLESARFFVSV